MRTTIARRCFATARVLVLAAVLAVCGACSSQSGDAVGEELQQTFETVYDKLGIPGAVIQIRFPDGSTWESMIGIAEATSLPSGTDIKWVGKQVTDPNTHTRIGSVTKTFTATLTLLLATKGDVELYKTIDHHLPNFGVNIPNSDQITVDQLLKMTSGLKNYSDLEAFAETWPPGLYTPQELIQLIVDHGGTDSKPGEKWKYCNTNYIILGLIAEAATGESYEDLVQERIIKPLGMQQTSVPQPTDEAIPAPAWHGYSIEVTPDTWEDFFVANMSWAWSAGNIISTRDDLMTWLLAFSDGTLLSDEMKTAQKTWVPIGHEGAMYGYGIARRAVKDGDVVVGYLEGHNGGVPGYETSAWKFGDYHIVVMCNGRQIPGREDLGHNGDYISIEMAKVLHRLEQ